MNQALIPICLVAAVGLAVPHGPVDATNEPNGPVEVTQGRFETLPGGAALGYDVRGGAIMFRSDVDGGTTTVRVRVRGLDPDHAHPTHVHNKPCSEMSGGGHYQHEVGGAVDPVNEMWPIVTTDSRGHGTGSASHAHRARPEAQSIVIHLWNNTSVRLACADLT